MHWRTKPPAARNGRLARCLDTAKAALSDGPQMQSGIKPLSTPNSQLQLPPTTTTPNYNYFFPSPPLHGYPYSPPLPLYTATTPHPTSRICHFDLSTAFFIFPIARNYDSHQSMETAADGASCATKSREMICLYLPANGSCFAFASSS